LGLGNEEGFSGDSLEGPDRAVYSSRQVFLGFGKKPLRFLSLNHLKTPAIIIGLVIRYSADDDYCNI
jgi:hypothetical protein